MIRAGWVLVNDEISDKPGTEFAIDASIRLKEQYEYVSRGGEKLAGAVETFQIDVTDRVCLDGGISTGGFTGYLLDRGGKAHLWYRCGLRTSRLVSAQRSQISLKGTHQS